MSSPGSQPPTSNAIANGPVTGASASPQGHPQMGPQSAGNAYPSVPPMGGSQRLSAPLSSGAVLTNGLSSQAPLNKFSTSTSSNVQGGVSHSGSAFTPVTSSHLSQPLQHMSATPPLPGQQQPGFPVPGQPNAHPQVQQTQFGQTTNYTGQAQGLPSPPSGLSPTSVPQVNQGSPLQPSGLSPTSVPQVNQGSPLQPSGVSPTSVPQGTQPLSALHSNKPKRPVMPMNTGYPGQRGSPSPRSTPPPPIGSPGSAIPQRSTPPPPSNSPGSTMPQAAYNSPAAGYPQMGQDSQAGARPISSRRRMYPAQVCTRT